jgi:hypothetical protein
MQPQRTHVECAEAVSAAWTNTRAHMCKTGALCDFSCCHTKSVQFVCLTVLLPPAQGRRANAVAEARDSR